MLGLLHEGPQRLLGVGTQAAREQALDAGRDADQALGRRLLGRPFGQARLQGAAAEHHGHAAQQQQRDLQRAPAPTHATQLGADGRVRVADFGIARFDPGATASTTTASATLDSGVQEIVTVAGRGGVVGTPAYMSPEQHADREVGPASDQFSFCVALYTALYGAHPFGATSLPAMITAVCDGTLASPPKIGRGGTRLVQKGRIGEMTLADSWPDGAIRFLRVSDPSGRATVVRLRREGPRLTQI